MCVFAAVFAPVATESSQLATPQVEANHAEEAACRAQTRAEEAGKGSYPSRADEEAGKGSYPSGKEEAIMLEAEANIPSGGASALCSRRRRVA